MVSTVAKRPRGLKRFVQHLAGSGGWRQEKSPDEPGFFLGVSEPSNGPKREFGAQKRTRIAPSLALDLLHRALEDRKRVGSSSLRVFEERPLLARKADKSRDHPLVNLIGYNIGDAGLHGVTNVPSAFLKCPHQSFVVSRPCARSETKEIERCTTAAHRT
jgi:hypothetical protein